MKSFLACAVVAALAMPLIADDDKWETVSSAEGKFKAEFPKKPTTIPGDKGIQIVLEAEGGKAAYMIQSSAVEISIDDKDKVKAIFDAGQSSMEKALKGTIASSKDGTFGDDKLPSRDIDMDAPSLGIYRVKLILDGKKMYQVTALGPKDFVNGKNVERFMKSFQIEK